ncbi:hypothetical protein [Pedobacter sp. Hv1]|uniref:hypothetical protein n=1 Tax=Pedobacter sp. Hv1 TaxID=1740090 RepID=UPI0006D8CB6C|nr:hypothetical protein [Pedobacter sp. Hv1]KQC00880.1 hypothetical protein AQF98_09395 [Pedobacter sp. Hv1]
MTKYFIVVCGVICLIFSACTKKITNTKEKRIKDGATIEIGAVLPEILSIKNDTASIVLAPRAQYFFIDLGLKGSAQNIKLIKEAKRLAIPVRATVFKDNGNEIAQIYPATEEEIKNYQKAKLKNE